MMWEAEKHMAQQIMQLFLWGPHVLLLLCHISHNPFAKADNELRIHSESPWQSWLTSNKWKYLESS